MTRNSAVTTRKSAGVAHMDFHCTIGVMVVIIILIALISLLAVRIRLALLTTIIGLRFGVQVYGSLRKMKWFGRARAKVMLRSFFYDPLPRRTRRSLICRGDCRRPPQPGGGVHRLLQQREEGKLGIVGGGGRGKGGSWTSAEEKKEEGEEADGHRRRRRRGKGKQLNIGGGG